MNCLICKTDISEIRQQFGDVNKPLCQSCFLAGNDWIYEDSAIVSSLENGSTLDEAMNLVLKVYIDDMNDFLRDE